LPVKLQKTFKALGVYKQREQANEFVRGRVAKYSVPDVMRNGMHLAMTKEAKVVVGTEGGVDVEELHETTVDGELEVEDDGDLDV
jgi:hypothetical protein